MSHVLHLMQVGLHEAYALVELVELDALGISFVNSWVCQWPRLYRSIKNTEGMYACNNRIFIISRLRRNTSVGHGRPCFN